MTEVATEVAELGSTPRNRGPLQSSPDLVRRPVNHPLFPPSKVLHGFIHWVYSVVRPEQLLSKRVIVQTVMAPTTKWNRPVVSDFPAHSRRLCVGDVMGVDWRRGAADEAGKLANKP